MMDGGIENGRYRKNSICIGRGDHANTDRSTEPRDLHGPGIRAGSEKLFGPGTREYTVLAAFQYAKKDKATKAEAVKIVYDFRNKQID